YYSHSCHHYSDHLSLHDALPIYAAGYPAAVHGFSPWTSMPSPCRGGGREGGPSMRQHSGKKRLGAVLLSLALCLGLLPVTALAAGEDAPGTLWVGQTQITASGYWKITTEGNLITGSENDYNVYYDGNGTLTLNNATIQGRGNISEGDPIDYGIYAASTSG